MKKVLKYSLNLGITKETTQITLIAGPGDKLKTIERIKPNKEIQSPKKEDLIIAILRLCAL